MCFHNAIPVIGKRIEFPSILQVSLDAIKKKGLILSNFIFIHTLISIFLSCVVAAEINGKLESPRAMKGENVKYYHTKGSTIVDGAGNVAHFNGINWFGFETSRFTLGGLSKRSMDGILDQIVKYGYNLLRVPYCNEMFTSQADARRISFDKNPDLVGLTPIEILDKLIQKAGKRGIKILLNRHRPTSSGQSELWYTSKVSEKRWIRDWEMLARRYLNDKNVIGADLHNEPHGSASWGTDDIATDWRLAAERAGNAILSINPHWIIVVEGVEKNVAGSKSCYWWGGNLSGVKKYPVRLRIPNQVVYSPRDYGPKIYKHHWFLHPNFPNNMSEIWDLHWGYIHKKGIAPILLGEFGAKDVLWSTKEGVWQNTLVNYLAENRIYWIYWCLNPNSGDTGGLLKKDWRSWNHAKQSMLDGLIIPPAGGINPNTAIERGR